jgi:carboxyl-terminal processing protease
MRASAPAASVIAAVLSAIFSAIVASSLSLLLADTAAAAPQDQTQDPAAQDDRPAQDRPTMTAGRPVPALHGVWRSRGYGYVLRIAPDGLKLFHVAGPFCYADARRKRDPDGLFVLYRPLGNGTVAFSGVPGQTRYVFDRLPDLPAACSDRTPWSPPRLAALVAATFADLYPTFAERGIDWRTRTAEAERTLNGSSDDAALFDTLRTMLAGIEDPHVELQATVRGKDREFNPGQARTLVLAGARNSAGSSARDEPWQKAYRRGVLDVVLQGKGREVANHRLIWGRAGDIGYLNLLTMERFSAGAGRPPDDATELDAALDDTMAAFKDARAVIVDISNNDGGFDSLAQRIAGRFADHPRLAYTKVAIGAHDVAPQPFEVAPSTRARYLGPVYLLTSDITLSAGEVFALYMRALPNVIHVGEITRGAFSDTINKPLPNGWTLILPGEIYRDPKGQSYEVRGLPPQRAFEVFPRDDLFGGHARRVLALMDDIRRELANAPAR